MLEPAEALPRWTRVRQLMSDNDLDAVLAWDRSRDEILHSHQRWLTGIAPEGLPAGVLIHRDGAVDLLGPWRIGEERVSRHAAGGFPVEAVLVLSTADFTAHLAKRSPKRIGIAEPNTLPYTYLEAMRASVPGLDVVDMSQEFLRLRMRKSPHEVAMVRESCAIADTVWREVPNFFKAGRKLHDILADVDHLARLNGSDPGFNLILKLPAFGMTPRDPDERVEADTRYLLEVSPRYRGYYSQLTLPVTTHADDVPLLRAYADVVAAKEAAQPLMRPGADLTDIAQFVADFLEKRGRSMTSRSLGHFCGVALEEPRHNPASPLVLEEDMTLIFHPVLADPELNTLMRADTYLITQNGAERLTRYDGGVLAIR